MNRRQKIIVSVTGIFLVLLILVGLTYAYFLTRIQGNEESKSISVTTANLLLVYGDGNGVLQSAEPLMPGKDVKFLGADGTAYDNKTFTVTNNGNDKVNSYLVYFENVTNTLLRPQDLVYTVECTSYTKYGTDEQAVSGECFGVSSETPLPVGTGTGTGPIVTNDIKVGITHEYKLKMKYIEPGVPQTDDMGKTIEAKINIADSKGFNPYKGNTSSLAYSIVENAKNKLNGTELVNKPLTVPAEEPSGWKYGKAEDPNVFNDSISDATDYYISYACDYTVNESNGRFTLGTDDCPVTTVKFSSDVSAETLLGKYAYWNTDETSAKNVTNLRSLYKISTKTEDIDYTNNEIYCASLDKHVSTESVLATTQDANGTSYYYRGGVKNNYVLFNNMCWRIVRIEGDGSVKLTLAGEVSNGATNCNEVTDVSGVLEDMPPYGYKTITGLDGTEWTIADYENNEQGKIDNQKGLKETLEEWFDTKFREGGVSTGTLTSSGQKVKTDTWCLGGNYNYKYNIETGELLDDAGLQSYYETNGAYEWYYSAGKRLLIDKTTDLRCGEDEDKIKSLIGTLTSDEATLAGMGNNATSSTQSHYLYENGKDKMYWTLSNSIGRNDIFTVSSSILHYFVGEVMDKLNFRPSVTLISGTRISDGNGTKTNPYIVE